jgi:hypothetical protein
MNMNDFIQMPVFQKAKKFIYKNARPLDFIRWRYHFENEKIDPVLETLMHYQNQDGGFASALEADSWNPNSSPIQTWNATEILHEINFTEKKHPVIQGILRYLNSGKHYSHNKWHNTIPSNNDYPGASWWNYAEETNAKDYNPTACLAGFALAYSEIDDSLWKKSAIIAREAADAYLKGDLLDDMHTALCYLRLVEYCEFAYIKDVIDIASLEKKLVKQVKHCITKNINEWETGYICKPSQFFNSRDSIFYDENRELAEYECDFIKKTQLADGSWEIPWNWNNYLEQWAISKNWWKSNGCIMNLLYIKGMSE